MITLPICEYLYDSTTKSYTGTDTFLKRAATPLPPDTKLYHGTSLWRFRDYKKTLDIVLTPGPYGHRHISLTTDRNIAEYWSDISTSADEYDCYLDNGVFSHVIFEFVLQDLLSNDIKLYHYSDRCFAGICYDKEKEICTPDEIALSKVRYIVTTW